MIKQIDGYNIKLIIIGARDEEHRLEFLEELKGLDNFELHAIISQMELADIFRESDIFILPSVEREGLGLAIIEAMAMKKPVIGSELGGIPEVIEDGVNGLLFPPGDTEKLSYAIDLLATDKHLREQMGKMGREVFRKKFSERQMINAIEAIYDNDQ